MPNPSLVSSAVRRAARGAYARAIETCRPVLGMPGRLVYGNDAGFLKNFRSSSHLKRLRSSAPAQSDLWPLAEELRVEGFVRLDGEYPSATLTRIEAALACRMEDPLSSFETVPGNTSRKIVRPLETIPDLRELVTPRVAGVLRTYYGTWFQVTTVTCWRNRRPPDYREGLDVYSNLWHCDHYYPYRMKLFVAMCDVTRASGAFRIHPLRSTRQIMRSGFVSRRRVLGPARHMLEDDRRIVYFEGPTGAAMICNTNTCLHRAGVPDAGLYRDMVEFQFEPSSRPPVPDYFARVKPDPDIPAHLR